MRNSLFMWLGAIVLTGCQTSTGILPAGPNTYTMTKHVAPVREDPPLRNSKL
jgi:hypothetical protein